MLSRLEFRGGGVNGILGDEMGLGKTVQVRQLNWGVRIGELRLITNSSLRSSPRLTDYRVFKLVQRRRWTSR